MKNFITNAQEATLKKRLETLINHSQELKFLVGFFYFSGWQSLIDSLQKNPDSRLKILVGLSVDNIISQSFNAQKVTVELPIDDRNDSNDERFQHFLTSLTNGINQPNRDNETFYQQVEFFIECLENGRLQLRKTEQPNHAKLYLFCLQQQGIELVNQNGCFITGSSNLTDAGLANQQEFNVEIKDYGFETAEQYFDDLWENAFIISEDDEYKGKIIDFFNNKSLCANITPYEAYALALKTYLDLQQAKEISPRIEQILDNNGFEKYQYQLDAVRQAVGIIDNYNGVIIADVVGLGKSVIASMIATHYQKRGLLICPPALMGDSHNKDSGWYEYLQKFELFNWDIVSVGKIDELAERRDLLDSYDMVIVDEAHRFRNQDSQAYASLANICRNKKVVLLTATPFNNSPADIFALLKLFIVPKSSDMTLDGDLDKLFSHFNSEFKKLSNLLRDLASQDSDKANKARKDYKKRFGNQSLNESETTIQKALERLSADIKKTISPVIIRRNRLDLLNDLEYKKEIGELSTVKNPQEQFFTLSKQQSAFYDDIIGDYFAKNDGVRTARFKGAIYTPALYQQGLDKKDLSLDENRSFISQKNLFDFMRRLLVKRFESAFGAFEQTIHRFEKVHTMALALVENSGRYILDRKIIEKYYDDDNQSFADLEQLFSDFQKNADNSNKPKDTEIYDINEFVDKDKFVEHIRSDLALFTEIKEKIQSLQLVDNDPKTTAVIKRIEQVLQAPIKNNEPKRKIILFSEYTDSIEYLEKSITKISPILASRTLFCYGNITANNRQQLQENFDAKSTIQKDDYDVLVATDKLSEGFNFNRAGLIINYDIPWNPTRVIQRVGRINRMSAKVFDELWIDNFFPSEQGADVVKSREIATHKMALIHNALGEDAKIFADDEAPSASQLFEKLGEISESEEAQESLQTVIRNEYFQIDEQTKQRIAELPNRVKTAKQKT
nr:DEAD/DEAH box helicase family protein [Moraxellaceae bacterium]